MPAGLKVLHSRWLLVGMLAGAALAPGNAGAASRPDARPFRFGAFERALGGLSLPSRAAIAPDGSIFVADAGDHQIVVFSPAGERLRAFGTLGAGEGQLHAPGAVALGDDGLVYVADTGNDRVQVFDMTGEFVRGWGTRGARAGQLCSPQGIAAHRDRVYVADTGNQHVKVFSTAGEILLDLGSTPRSTDAAAAGAVSVDLFRQPVDVAVDDAGRLFVLDADRNCVVHFQADGQYLGSWGDYGPFAGLLNEPQGLACCAGEVLVADTANHRVQVFDASGQVLRQWGVHDPASHEGNGRIHYPRDVAIAGDGSFAVICEPLEHRCQIFRALGPGQVEEPRQGLGPGAQTHFGQRLAIDGRLMLIPEPESHFIYVFDLQQLTPIIISQFGERGAKFGQFIRPGGLVVSEAERTALIADPSTARLQTFALDFQPDAPLEFHPAFARLLRSIDLSHPRFAELTAKGGPTWPMLPESIRRDRSGNLHVLDRRNGLVVVFDPRMQFLRAYGQAAGSAPGLREPSDFALSPDESVAWVVDAGNFRVLGFDREGRPLTSIGSFGDGDGQFRRPFGVAVDNAGFVYVSDSLADCVQKFDPAGRFVGRWGTRGPEHGQFWRPMGMAIDSRDRLVVIDHGNHRAQMFSLEGEWLGTFGAGRVTLKPTEE